MFGFSNSLQIAAKINPGSGEITGQKRPLEDGPGSGMDWTGEFQYPYALAPTFAAESFFQFNL
jgi:hypothetical protein